MYEDKVQIAIALCDPLGTFSRHAAVTIASIYANSQSQLCVNLIHDNSLSEDNREKLEKTAMSFNQHINFINVESMINEDSIDVTKLTSLGSRGTLFRLILPDVLNLDKIIYLDCDIVVNVDITELWDIDLENKAVAAVLDFPSRAFLKNNHKISWRNALLWKTMDINFDSYFNAGVLVMNLKKIREEYDFLSKVAEFYSKFKNCITLADQDCLNYIFSKDCLFIDEKFNNMDSYNPDENDLKGNIFHMAGEAKPWTAYTRPNVDELYWQYLMLTPYCKDQVVLIKMMLSDLSSTKYLHLHTSDCFKRLEKQLIDNIFRCHIIKVPYTLAAAVKKYFGK